MATLPDVSACTPAARSVASWQTLTDAELVAAAQQFEAHAFEALMRRYNRRLFRVARSILREEDAAEDAVQEAYIRAFTHLSQYQPTGSFAAWLTRLAINEALMLKRRLHRRPLFLDDLRGDDMESDAPSVSAAMATPDGTEQTGARQLLEQAIDRLPQTFRTVFVLREVEQLSVAETAASLGLNEATVKSRLHRARARLRRICRAVCSASSSTCSISAASAATVSSPACSRNWLARILCCRWPDRPRPPMGAGGIMTRPIHSHFAAALALLAALMLFDAAAIAGSDRSKDGDERKTDLSALEQIRKGRQTFRYATFGDEDFWGGTLGLHETIAGGANGGSGPGLSPKAALSLGLKVDVTALPGSVRKALRAGTLNLDDPAVTIDLLRLGAVIGVTGFFDRGQRIKSIGIQCSLCHSTVDDSFAPGIGNRRDGWANRDLNVGAIIAFAPRLQSLAALLGVDVPTVRTVLAAWGPGKFDAELFLDGKAFRPDGRSAATLIPPAFGLAGVNLHTWTGWGSVTHWNAFVANLEMHGKGTFYDPRLDDADKFPIAARERFGHVRAEEDQITPELAALHLYQLALEAPAAPRGSYDKHAASRGRAIFNGKAQCAGCHVPPLYTEPGYNMHKPEEIGIDAFQANRSPDGRYRTAPLRGLWTHTRGGFYHDGRFATLAEVIGHYDQHGKLNLTANERQDLEQYLRSL